MYHSPKIREIKFALAWWSTFHKMISRNFLQHACVRTEAAAWKNEKFSLHTVLAINKKFRQIKATLVTLPQILPFENQSFWKNYSCNF